MCKGTYNGFEGRVQESRRTLEVLSCSPSELLGGTAKRCVDRRLHRLVVDEALGPAQISHLEERGTHVQRDDEGGERDRDI